MNGILDALAIAASTLEPVSQSPLKRFSVELVSTPVVLNNINHFQIFDGDRHILSFLANLGAFKEQIMDEEDRSDGVDEDEDEEIINLPTNVIPKGMVTLERLFDFDPRVKYEPHNIGPEGQEKIVYIGKICSPTEREKILQILKEYIDLIAWGYKNMKNMIHLLSLVLYL